MARDPSPTFWSTTAVFHLSFPHTSPGLSLHPTLQPCAGSLAAAFQAVLWTGPSNSMCLNEEPKASFTKPIHLCFPSVQGHHSPSISHPQCFLPVMES